MYEVLNRRLTESEKRQLGSMVSRPLGPFQGLELKVVAHATAAVIFGVLSLIVLSDLHWRLSPGPIICLIAYLLYLVIQSRALLIRPSRLYRQSMAPYRRFQDVLANATSARVQRIRSTEVVQIDHDEGCFYLFSIGANAAFWTSVQAPSTAWPNSDFEIFTIPGLEDELGPVCHGEQLTPRRKIRFSDYFENFDFHKLPADGVINSSVDSFLETAAAGPKSAV